MIALGRDSLNMKFKLIFCLFFLFICKAEDGEFEDVEFDAQDRHGGDIKVKAKKGTASGAKYSLIKNEIYFYRGKDSFLCKSDTGSINTKTLLGVLKGNVLILSKEKKISINAQYINFDLLNRKFTTNKHFNIKIGELNISGHSFNIENNNIEVKKDVLCVVN